MKCANGHDVRDGQTNCGKCDAESLRSPQVEVASRPKGWAGLPTPQKVSLGLGILVLAGIATWAAAATFASTSQSAATNSDGSGSGSGPSDFRAALSGASYSSAPSLALPGNFEATSAMNCFVAEVASNYGTLGGATDHITQIYIDTHPVGQDDLPTIGTNTFAHSVYESGTATHSDGSTTPLNFACDIDRDGNLARHLDGTNVVYDGLTSPVAQSSPTPSPSALPTAHTITTPTVVFRAKAIPVPAPGYDPIAASEFARIEWTSPYSPDPIVVPPSDFVPSDPTSSALPRSPWTKTLGSRQIMVASRDLVASLSAAPSYTLTVYATGPEAQVECSIVANGSVVDTAIGDPGASATCTYDLP